MKKNILLIIIFLLITVLPLADSRAGEQTAPAKTKITICPEIYRAGEETFYLQGIAPSDSQLTLQLKKEEKIIQEWMLKTSNQGEWSFTANNLFSSGDYIFSIQDQSGSQDQCQTKIKLSGLAFLFLKISYRNLSLVLAGVLLVLLLAALTLVYKKQQTKKRLAKEIYEARNILSTAFVGLNEQIRTKIEQIDAQPGFNPEEKKLYQELKQNIQQTQELIKKEIEDIEKFV